MSDGNEGHSSPWDDRPTLAGWYPDPFSQQEQFRYWDGQTWTEKVGPQRSPASSQSRGRRQAWPWMLGAASIVLIVVVILAAVVILRSQPTGTQEAVTAPSPASRGSQVSKPTPDISGDSPSPSSEDSTPPRGAPVAEGPGKKVAAALARYATAYRSFFELDTLDFGQPLRSQLQPRLADLEGALEDVESEVTADTAASDPGSNFGALLTALKREVQGVRELVGAVEDCSGLLRDDLRVCQAATVEARLEELEENSNRVQVAIELLDLPPAESPDSEVVASDDVGVGECFVRLEGIAEVPCDVPHDGEVFAVYLVPQSRDAPFPGEPEMQRIAMSECSRRFEGYVGVDAALSDLVMLALYPIASTWAHGDRSISCIVALEGERLTGSVRGSGR